jgi:nucleoside-diphosphate-sugar epimerase
VLVTGAAGRIGSTFAEHTRELYDLRLMVRGDEEKIGVIEPWGEVVQCDLADLEGLTAVCEGIDTVLHLAADHRVHAPWEDLLPNNIVGVYHLFAAAKAQGCRRVIFASSVNAMNGTPHETQVRSDDPVNPGNLYGVSKCFGESLCRYYATRQEMSGIAIRIGGFQPLESIKGPMPRPFSGIFVSYRDLMQLLVKCVDDEKLQFAIFQGLSNNRHNAFDISDARQLLGYAPIDDAFNPEN